ncbi:hypothetical protein NC652_009713 [Populus alba x Populus x berolinensis]|nr:hypothetical protein NC652_009713 [Populus alba x Populus x berolinensis]
MQVRVTGRLRLWKVSPGGAERLSGFEVGDWMLKRYLVSKCGSMLKRYLWIAHHRRYHLVEKAPPADLEVEQIFEVGEWEKQREDISNWKSVAPGSGFVVQGIRYDGDNWGSLYVGFSGEQERWAGPTSHLERAERLMIGQRFRVKLSVKQPRLGWSGHTHGSGARRG